MKKKTKRVVGTDVDVELEIEALHQAVLRLEGTVGRLEAEVERQRVLMCGLVQELTVTKLECFE